MMRRSLPNRSRHSRCDSTATLWPVRQVSSSVNVLPNAARAPRTEKKLPVPNAGLTMVGSPPSASVDAPNASEYAMTSPNAATCSFQSNMLAGAATCLCHPFSGFSSQSM